jgi:hypothetical protein
VKVIEEPQQLVVKRKWPWLIDIFLYPISASGVIHIAVFAFLPLFVSFLVRLVPDPHFAWLSYPVYIVFVGYLFYYFSGCVLDSAKGGFRAVDINVQTATFDMQDCFSEIFLMLACIAICSLSAGVYYIIVQRTDLLFWILVACGIFFLPMTLLRGIMFDSYDALNPMSIIGSIASTFLSYCGLVVFFCGIGGFVVFILPRLAIWRLVSSAIRLYLLFVMAHLLGRFYWRYKEKLYWEV